MFVFFLAAQVPPDLASLEGNGFLCNSPTNFRKANDRKADACKWNGQKVCILDLPRATTFSAYDSVEGLKNGMLVKDKYEVEDRIDPEQPFVVIFSNQWPDQTRRPGPQGARQGERGEGPGSPTNKSLAQVDRGPGAHHPLGGRD